MSPSTPPRTSQRIVEAFADRDALRDLMRDRDRVYGNEVRLRIASLHTEEVLTAPRSPWQNPYAERLIGSIRRDCLNPFRDPERQASQETLASYFAYSVDRGPIWASTSNVRFLGRYRVWAGSSRSRNSAVWITVMNVLPRNDIPPDAILAKDWMAEIPSDSTARAAMSSATLCARAIQY
jgi:hypothetical protein